MAVNWRVRFLDAIRRRIAHVPDMSLEEIQAARGPRVPAVPVVGPLLHRLGERLLFGVPHPHTTIETRQVEGAEGPLPVRVYTPDSLAPSDPLVVYYHGGGFTVGAPEQYDWLCSRIAEEVGAVVVSVDYRKAPESPAPAAYDDVVAAYDWILHKRTTFGVAEAGPMAVAGDSAGGNLAALVAVAARDRGWRLDAQVLIYPSVDQTLSFDSIHELSDEPILPRQSIDAFRAHYLSGGIPPDDPRVSPWFVEDLSGVAPALVQTAEHDPLVDEGDAYAARLADEGGEVRHTRYVDAPHGFVSLPGVVPAGRQAAAEITTFLRRHLLGDHDSPAG